MAIRPSELDHESRDYLLQIWQTKGKSNNGVFIPQKSSKIAAFFTVLGSILLFVAACLSIPPASLESVSGYQTVLAFLGVFFLGVGVDKLRGNWKEVGSFWFIDGGTWWEVTPRSVNIIPIDDIVDFQDTRRFNNGLYQRTYFRIITSTNIIRRSVQPLTKVRELTRFLDAILRLRTEDAETGTSRDSATIGAIASAEIASYRSRSEPLSASPIPEPDPVGRTIPRGTLLAFGLAVLIAIGAFFGFTLLNDFTSEMYLYDKMVSSKAGIGAKAGDEYLRRFPNSTRADEVRQIRDELRFLVAKEQAFGARITRPLKQFLNNPDHKHSRAEAEAALAKLIVEIDDEIFDQAKKEAETKKSPVTLRRYLANADNVRHRAEAQRLINGYYDKAIERLREVSKDRDVNRELYDGLVALLEALKSANSPVITVGFQGKRTLKPNNDQAKRFEQREVNAMMRKHGPELRQIAKTTPDQTAFLPVGGVFEPTQIEKRERLILELLKASFAKIFDNDLLELRRAAPGKKPIINVAYHTHPGGQVYLYTTTKRPPGMPFAKGTKIIRGLLRGYQIDWTIRIEPPGGNNEFIYRVPSDPSQSLRYNTQPNDPEWAMYAIMLRSAFHHMSSQTIQNMGLRPPVVPQLYTFNAPIGRLSPPIDVFKKQARLTEQDQVYTTKIPQARMVPGLRHKKTYSISLQANTNYVLEVESKDFDTFLQIDDPGDGFPIWNDDRLGGSTRNSQIIFNPRVTRVYQITVTSYEARKTGKFNLTVYR